MVESEVSFTGIPHFPFPGTIWLLPPPPPLSGPPHMGIPFQGPPPSGRQFEQRPRYNPHQGARLRGPVPRQKANATKGIDQAQAQAQAQA
jgi:hypothetical protein